MSLDFLYYPIAWVMKLWHTVLSTFLDPDSGVAWAFSIVLLVVTVRVLLFPLFVKQIKSQRAMQELQPDIANLKKEFGKDRQGMAEAQQKLFKERGVNPLSGCLPIVLQAPVFIALLHVLRRLSPDAQGLYSWDDALTRSAAKAMIFGAPVSSNWSMSGDKLQRLIETTGTTSLNIKIVTSVLIVVMCITQFFSTKQIMKRSGPVEGQMAMVQKLMLYGAPIGLLFSGTFFPLGVLMYWFTNNLWTIGQQFWVLKKHPSVQQLAHEAKQAEAPVDPKKLAPRPGAKPIRAKAATVVATDDLDDTLDEHIAETSAPASPPRSGKRTKTAPVTGAKVTVDGTKSANGAPSAGAKSGNGATPANGAKRSNGAKPANGSRPANVPASNASAPNGKPTGAKASTASGQRPPSGPKRNKR